MLATLAVVAVSAVTTCTARPLFVITATAILTSIVYLALTIVLTVFAGEVLTALTHVATVSVVDARATVQTGHAIITSSRVALTVN